MFVPSPPSRRVKKVPPRAAFANANVRPSLFSSNLGALSAHFEKRGALTRRLRDAEFVRIAAALLRRRIDVSRFVFRLGGAAVVYTAPNDVEVEDSFFKFKLKSRI